MREDHPFGSIFVVLYLFDEQGTGVEILSRVITAGVVTVIIEHVKSDVLLCKEVEQFGVEIKFAVEVECVDILNGYWDAWCFFWFKVKCVVFPAESTGLGDVVVTGHNEFPI